MHLIAFWRWSTQSKCVRLDGLTPFVYTVEVAKRNEHQMHINRFENHIYILSISPAHFNQQANLYFQSFVDMMAFWILQHQQICLFLGHRCCWANGYCLPYLSWDCVLHIVKGGGRGEMELVFYNDKTPFFCPNTHKHTQRIFN